MQTREGNTAHVDHANVLYQIPAKEKASPVVFLHGYGQSRMGWMITLDGREGWSDIALRNGRSVFLVDQPRRGEAGISSVMTSGFIDTFADKTNEYLPGDQAWYTHFRIGRVAPRRYDGSQFPEGDEALNQFFRQMTPNTGAYDEKLFGAALSEVLSDSAKITGKISDFESYDTVFVGYPIWNADLPPVLYSFFDAYDLGGKKIVPFTVHGGSGLAGTPRTIARLEPKAVVEQNAFSESRNTVDSCKERVSSWLKKISEK